MKKIFQNKIVAISVLYFFVAIIVLSIVPKKADAIFGAGDVVFDPTTFVQTYLTSYNSASINYSTQSTNYKEMILDPLAWTVAKMLIQQLTSQLVNWINSGFDNNPAFLTNPQGFFLDVADQATGELIAKNGALSAFCKPLQANLRISLAFSFSYTQRQRYSCTLGSILQSYGVDVNGFLNGNSTDTSWPAFVALTSQPQNSPVGAYLVARSDLNTDIANRQKATKEDLNRGNGFMSWRSCKDLNINMDDEDAYDQAMAAASAKSSVEKKTIKNADGTTKVIYQSCTTETPGSVIKDSLQKQLGSSVDTLVTADEFDEIISALFSQLMNQILNKGLLSASKPSSGGSPSYTSQLINATINEQQVSDSKDQISASAASYIAFANDYVNTESQAVSLMNSAVDTLMATKSCLTARLTATGGTDSTTLAAIAKIDQALASATQLQTQYQNNLSTASSTLATLIDIKNRADNSTGAAELSGPSTDLGRLLGARAVYGANDVQEARDDTERATTSSNQFKTTAGSVQSLCAGYGTTATTTTP